MKEMGLMRTYMGRISPFVTLYNTVRSKFGFWSLKGRIGVVNPMKFPF